MLTTLASFLHPRSRRHLLFCPNQADALAGSEQCVSLSVRDALGNVVGSGPGANLSLSLANGGRFLAMDLAQGMLVTSPAASAPVEAEFCFDVEISNAGHALVAVATLANSTVLSATSPSFSLTPSLAGINPASGTERHVVTITGHGFDPAATTVEIGGAPCDSPPLVTPTTIACLVPDGAGFPFDVAQPVRVWVASVPASQPLPTAVSFTYVKAPTVASLAPVAGAIGGGEPVVIRSPADARFLDLGTLAVRFAPVTSGGGGDVTVTVNSTNGLVAFTSPTTVSVLTPAVMTSGPYRVSVSNDGVVFSTPAAVAGVDLFTFFGPPDRLELVTWPVPVHAMGVLAVQPVLRLVDAAGYTVKDGVPRNVSVSIVATRSDVEPPMAVAVTGASVALADGRARFEQLGFDGARGAAFTFIFAVSPPGVVPDLALANATRLMLCPQINAGSEVVADGVTCACSAGFESELPGGPCQPCGNGRFKAVVASAVACQPCADPAADTAGLIGSVSEAACVCLAGYYGPVGGGNGADARCAECPPGGVCSGGGGLEPGNGWWRPDADSDVLVECELEGACLGGPESACAAGYEGPICGACGRGFLFDADDRTCRACGETPDGGQLVRAVGLACLVAGVLTGLAVVALRSPHHRHVYVWAGVARIAVRLLQALSFIGLFRIEWPPAMGTALRALALSNGFLFASFSPVLACGNLADAFGGIWVGATILTPIAVCLVPLLASAASACCASVRRPSKDGATGKLWRAPKRLFLALLVLFWWLTAPGVAAVAGQAFSCRSIAGLWVLVADVRLTCGESSSFAVVSHPFMVVVSAVVLAVYGLVAPLGLGAYLWTRRDVLWDGDRPSSAVAFVFSAYDRPWILFVMTCVMI